MFLILHRRCVRTAVGRRASDPASIIDMLNDQQRTVLRITPEHVILQE